MRRPVVHLPVHQTAVVALPLRSEVHGSGRIQQASSRGAVGFGADHLPRGGKLCTTDPGVEFVI